MSRIGNMPVNITSGVTISLNGQNLSVSGPLGELSIVIPASITAEMTDRSISFKRKNNEGAIRSLHGLTRALVANMVTGVSKGWDRKLELVGVGYRAQTTGDKLTLNVGFSHPVEIVAPEGVKFTVADNTKMTVSGFDKVLVGTVAAKVRAVKPPEPYQGKGIRYSGEYVRRKAGKAGKVGAGAAK